MRSYPKSAEILAHNRKFIPGGVVSTNRATQPEIVFVRAQGAELWDAEGCRYIDYHAAFAPHLLGHNDPYVTEAVQRTLAEGASLYGTGTTTLEGRLAEMIVEASPAAELVELLNTGSEATAQAMRLARAATGRDHFIVMQGGYNGWHDDVCCNLMTPLEQLGSRVSPGEYAFAPMSAGIPASRQALIHPVNFNDLASVEYVCEKYDVAGLITEPILQNIGIVHPQPGYLEGLRRLADRYGFVLVFDEVKTGFRHGLGGYAQIAGVRPDLVVYGKALASGYPIAALGGRRELMELFVHPDPSRRVLLAGTYNAHPVPTAAAIATLERLMQQDGEVYRRTESLGERIEAGLEKALESLGVTATVCRQGSAFCIYFMDHAPVDWHDLAAHHNFAFDQKMRLELVDRGVYFFPLATKQCSISFAHTEEQIDETVAAVAEVVGSLTESERLAIAE
ncbi:MAG: aminotransferase class III-fold pyridoxal phosphate-dependent enzyme [Acidobacteria bacterium]|nr:aminotransferase class III-fold pyridoxal phosphate-dependent enzyme [Acidobacteriota bacterium]